MEEKEIPEMVSEDSVWSRRPGFKYQLWTCIKLLSFYIYLIQWGLTQELLEL